jgi:hypothetical protein
MTLARINKDAPNTDWICGPRSDLGGIKDFTECVREQPKMVQNF